MSNVTKEWLQKTIAELEEERDAVPGVVNEDAAMALAAMKLALASLEADPVGYIDAEYTELIKSGHIESCSVYAEPVEGCIPVYAAPAPVSVPDRSMFEEWWESEHGSPFDSWDSLRTTDGYCDEGIDVQFEAWIACRAAMLQGGKA
ncbi:hypothetical protein [Enterobacter chengduensis]|uniref:hypothetical protein n=1 Tax=Enterobacter chengduensis TaxID=2494701 RepID=UPI0005F0B968|nr:hypothetical protein [Enterobacter chengduensis]KJM01267.1 hypothetical protein SS39_14585 [Enterobacter chengduensis]KJM05085.1 hypothetical protein SS50_10460 [Enterobacter chengduensis]